MSFTHQSVPPSICLTPNVVWCFHDYLECKATVFVLSRALLILCLAKIFPGIAICTYSNIPCRHNLQIYSQVPPNSASGPEDPAAPHIRELQLAVDGYLRKCSDTFNLERNCEVSFSNGPPVDHSSIIPCLQEVLNQICSTLFDYPMIRNCSELVKYINNCVTTAWGLSTQV